MKSKLYVKRKMSALCGVCLRLNYLAACRSNTRVFSPCVRIGRVVADIVHLRVQLLKTTGNRWHRAVRYSKRVYSLSDQQESA